MTTNSKNSEMGYVYAAITLLIWSGFVIVSRFGSKGVLNPFDIAALRIGTAALVLSPWWIPRLLKPRLRQLSWYQSLLFALIAGIIYPLLAYTGFIYAPAGHGAVLISGMLPFFTSVLAIFLLKEIPNTVRSVGLALIVSGVITLLIANEHGSSKDTSMYIIGDAILLVASLVWATFTVLLKYWQVRAFDVTLGVVAVSALVYLPIYALFLPKNIAAAPIGQIACLTSFLSRISRGLLCHVDLCQSNRVIRACQSRHYDVRRSRGRNIISSAIFGRNIDRWNCYGCRNYFLRCFDWCDGSIFKIMDNP